MALPDPVYDKRGHESDDLSARERADARWGIAPQKPEGEEAEKLAQQDGQGDESTGKKESAISRARKRWGKADKIEGDGEDGEGEDEKKEPDSYWKPDPNDSKKKLGLKGRWKASSTTKKWAIGASAGALVTLVGAIVGLVMFLMPFKVSGIIAQIEQRVGQVPEYAIEHRMEYYLNRYLILRQIAKAVGEERFENERRGTYVFLGDGVFETLYTNWKGANLEGKLLAQGWQLEAKNPPNTGQIWGRQYVEPSEWRLINLNVSANSALRSQELNSVQARSFIREFSKSETKSHQVMKRHNMRKMLKRYYGVNDWKFFERQRAEARTTYLAKKLAIKKTLVNKTVGVVSQRYGIYINCLLDGGDDCREGLGKGADTNDRTSDTRQTDPDTGAETGGGGGSEFADNAASDAGVRSLADDAVDVVDGAITDAAGNVTDEAISRSISSSIQEIGLKKILASFVAGLGLLDTFAQIVRSVDSGALNAVIYDKNAQQYAAFTAPILSMADQIKAGEDVSLEDARVLNEIFNNYQESPVFKSQYGSYTGNIVSAQGSEPNRQFRRDCNNDGDTTDEEDLLDVGETVCEGKKLNVDKLKFTNNDAWQGVARAADAYENSVGGIFRVFDNLVGGIMEALRIDDLIASAMERFGITDALMAGFKTLLNVISGPVLTGAEVEGDAYDAVYAGITTNYSSLGGGVGQNREETMGGAILNDEQLAVITNEQAQQRQFAASQRSFTERYLSLENTDSLASKFVLNMPTTADQAVSTVASLPKMLLGSFSSLLSLPVGAQTSTYSPNPFDAIYYGFPADHPVFTDNGGTGMDPDVLHERYHCDVTDAAERQELQAQDAGVPAYSKHQEDLGINFEVANVPDPCLLEKTIEDVGSMAYTKRYDEGITGGGSSDLIAGQDIEGRNTDDIPCPSSPTIEPARIESDAWKNGQQYDIQLCLVHGVEINSIVATSFDNLFTAMAEAGYTVRGTGGYRSSEGQESGFGGGSGSNTFSRPGYSNHQFGAAADISCQGGGQEYQQGTGRYRAAFLENIASYPCLNFIHENSSQYGLLLMCDAKGNGGGEMRADSGGCEWWHLSPTGG